MSRPHATDLIERARALWIEGLTCRVIGNALNISHNSVASMARTYGFPKRPQCERIARMKAAQRGEYEPAASPSARIPSRRSAAEPQRLGALSGNAAHYFALGGGCRWITKGEPGMYASMCGEDRVKGRPYCRRHCARAYQVPKPGIEKLRVR